MSLRTLAKRGETVPTLFNDLFRTWDPFFDFNGGSLRNTGSLNTINIPAANVIEEKGHYEVSLAAPGMKKEDFNIDVEGNVLTISSEKEENKEEKDDKYTRKEFSYASFSRSFTLPDWVNKDKIDASYENGLLKVNLPKTEEGKKLSSKHITVR